MSLFSLSIVTFLPSRFRWFLCLSQRYDQVQQCLPELMWWWHIFNQQFPPQSCYPVFCPTECVFLQSCRLRINSRCIKLQRLTVITSFYALIVLLNLLFDVRELVLQVLTPLPFFQICGVLRTRKKNRCKLHVLPSFGTLLLAVHIYFLDFL